MRLASEDLDAIVERGRDDFRSLGSARIFVTGGTGFFGTWLLESFAEAVDRLGLDTRLIVLSRDPAAFAERSPHLASHRAISFVHGDVLSLPAGLGTFDAAIHAATAASLALTLSAPRTMADTIVTGTANVLDLLAASGSIPVLFTSSGAVYGRQPPDVTLVGEDHLGGPDPLDAGAVYGEAKRMAEMLCVLGASDGPAVKVARCFAFVGAHLPLDAHFAVGNFIRDALAGGPIVVGGDGTPLRSYLYGTDLVGWLLAILARGRAGRAYNVGSEEAVTIAEVARITAAQAGGIDVEIRGTPRPDTPRQAYVPSTLRARTELGLSTTVGFEEAVRRTLSWNRTAAQIARKATAT